jgi:nuclear transport factor 2 (NTF2) superfamily protein
MYLPDSEYRSRPHFLSEESKEVSFSRDSAPKKQMFQFVWDIPSFHAEILAIVWIWFECVSQWFMCYVLETLSLVQ